MATNEGDRCPLCNLIANSVHSTDGDHVKCANCGEFNVVRTLLRTAFAAKDKKDLLPYLSAHTRQATEREETITLDTANWKNYALLHQNTPVSRKLIKLLELTAERSKPAGSPVRFSHTDAPLVDAKNENELAYLLEQLDRMGYLESVKSVDRGIYILAAKGWEKLEATSFAGKPGKCFVAMSFDDSLDQAYERGIKLAIEVDCKMEAINLKHVLHNEKICDKIIAEILTSQFLVADVTRASQNVYFEAGFAMGLGRPVIWTCHAGTFDQDVRFDTRQYGHIPWKSADDLRLQLTNKIRATIPEAKYRL
jgi:hypothetical protein